MEPVTLEILDFKSANKVVLIVQQYCLQIGFNKLDTNLVASAVSEITTNVVKYGTVGYCILSEPEQGTGIKITISDSGKGIEDIDRALKDGFTTDSSSLGIGLGAAKRAMNYFHIHSKRNKGTTITMEKWLPVPASKIEYAAVSLPDRHYIYNGDGYVFKEFKGNSLFVSVIDGLGEGFNAWQTTENLKEILEEEYMLDLKLLMYKCETNIKNTNWQSGAAIGLLKITPGKLSYLGIGDTSIKIVSEKAVNFNSQSGIVGAFAMPRLKTQTTTLETDATIVLCTDGISQLKKATLPLTSSPREIAEYIFRNYRRQSGDATVAVIKVKTP